MLSESYMSTHALGCMTSPEGVHSGWKIARQYLNSYSKTLRNNRPNNGNRNRVIVMLDIE